MCGIAGVVRFGPNGERVDATLAPALGRALAHRGPDGDGSYLSPDGRALLVHRRLAIIDLSPAAAQPMASRDGRYRIVFNGEIYNYRELRAELERSGQRFSTGSDTEVLLRLLMLHGPTGLALARGMFALAVWDEQQRTLLAARDRYGIKPLYVAASAERVAFASELAALVRPRLVERRISGPGILAYLSWGSIPPPLTWIEGVESVPAGTWRRWHPSGMVERGVFADARTRFAATSAPTGGEDELRERVRHALFGSVKAHLVADVPVGVFLSGGIDSAALVSVARACTNVPLRTYTVAFEEDAYSEAPLAACVAERYGTRHEVATIRGADVQREIPDVMGRLDQPTIDAVNSYYISRAVASTGLKAVLSGVGGDELFGGYPSFRRIPRAMRVPVGALRAAGPLAGATLPAWRRTKWAHFYRANGSLEELYRAQRGLFMPAELPALLGPALADRDARDRAAAALLDVERELLAAAGPEAPEAGVARLETRVYMGSQLLRDLDVMSMAQSLEVRVPFVDHQLTAAVWPALAHHPHLLLRKRLLTECLDAPLPPAILKQPKRGFLFPFNDWLRGDLGAFVRDGMNALARDGWVASGAPESIWRAWETGAAHWSRPWALGVLGHFLRRG
jgi:asparagine synthase (glutamine-hydrolysing)